MEILYLRSTVQLPPYHGSALDSTLHITSILALTYTASVESIVVPHDCSVVDDAQSCDEEAAAMFRRRRVVCAKNIVERDRAT